MFGLGKNKKIKEIEERFSQSLVVLSSGGNERAMAGMSGIKSALSSAKTFESLDYENDAIVYQLNREARKRASENPGYSIGYSIVSMIYEARALNTKASLALAMEIQRSAMESAAKLQSYSSRPEPKKPSPVNTNTRNNDISDEYLEGALKFADLLKMALTSLKVYSERPNAMLRPHALGYTWGWCDAATQLLGIPKNSGESLGVMAGMFVSIYGEENFGYKENIEKTMSIFKSAQEMMEEKNPLFTKSMYAGGNDIVAYINEEKIPEGLDEAFL